MKIEQRRWTKDAGWTVLADGGLGSSAQLVLLFGSTLRVSDAVLFDQVRSAYPNAHIVSCSTAGEIIDGDVLDDSLVLTAVHFEKTTLRFAQVKSVGEKDGAAVGEALAGELAGTGLVHVMTFSDGLHVNGTSLVRGLLARLPADVSVTGGLAGDGSAFKRTCVGLDEAAGDGRVVAVGFYGEHLRVGYGSLGGWDAFGLERTITKSSGNVLYEIDGKPALQLYKEYLGDKARDLPGSGLLFPLSLRMPTADGGTTEVVRTLLAVDEGSQSMTFAGDMPQGAPARLMKANFDRLVDGAAGAAGASVERIGDSPAQLAILISCVGRRLVLKERICDEIDAVRAEIGAGAAVTGFYSYGEICPTAPTERQCQLHNQTMTVTVFREA